MTRRRKCNLVGVLLGLVLVAPPITMLLDRRMPVRLNGAASQIHPNPARGGDTISITWHAVAVRNCAGTVIPRIIDSSGHIYEYARIPTVYQDIMREGTFTKLLTLPSVMSPGPARYQAIVIRWCNRVQEVFWPMIDEPFPIRFDVTP